MVHTGITDNVGRRHSGRGSSGSAGRLRLPPFLCPSRRRPGRTGHSEREGEPLNSRHGQYLPPSERTFDIQRARPHRHRTRTPPSCLSQHHRGHDSDPSRAFPSPDRPAGAPRVPPPIASAEGLSHVSDTRGDRQDRVSIQGSGARYDGHAAREGGDTGPRPASSIRPRCGAMRLHLAMHLAMHGRSSGRTWKGEGKGGEGWVDGGNGERSCHGRVFGWGKAKRRTGEGNRWSLLLRRLADRETPVTMR